MKQMNRSDIKETFECSESVAQALFFYGMMSGNVLYMDGTGMFINGILSGTICRKDTNGYIEGALGYFNQQIEIYEQVLLQDSENFCAKNIKEQLCSCLEMISVESSKNKKISASA